MTISLRTGITAAALAAWMLSMPAAFAQGAKPTAAAPTTLSFNWEGAYGRANILVWPFRPGGRYEQLVTQHTNGTVKLDIKDKLFGLMDSAFAIGDGRVAMGTQSIPAASGTYPLLDFGGIPGLFSEMPNGATEYANALLDPAMTAAMDEYTKRAGFKVLGAAISLANNSLWGNKPIRTLADFKGVKMRASGRTQTSALRDLGGSPLTLSMAEIEQALSRGTVDAITTSKSFGAERGLTQLAKYVSIWPITPIFPQVIAINFKVWDKLTPEQQQGLVRASAQLTREMPTALEQMDIVYTLWIRSTKTEMVIPEDAEVKKGMALMQPVVKEWIDTAGPEGKQVLRIAARHAKGPSAGLIAEMAK
ncbi:MAG TPA: TRAP transporter substrate-binding protein DctP [Burkholderiales bacterium]|jgi:TRAP-type C4-dicarboxylate transport system substrate-binding protein|nr:TRAP transporter substrate-binding protein DctP [Burkholderiales bacterium]